MPGKGIVYTKDGTPIELSFDVGDYHYELKLSLDTEIATVDITVSREIAGPAGAKFTAKGEISRFRSKNQIVFEEGEVQEFGHEMNGMQGELTLELVVAASGSDAVNYKMPVTILKVPFLVGPVPVVLNIKAQFVINAVVPLDGSSSVRTKFTYNSDIGVNFDGVNVSAGGRMGPIQFGQDVNQTGASSAISANFGIGFPRVELSVFHETLVPWAQTAFLVGGSYTFTPACQTADAEFIGAIGYDLGFLGFNLLSGSKTLFDEKKPLLRSGDCPEEKIGDEFWDAGDLLVEPDVVLQPAE